MALANRAGDLGWRDAITNAPARHGISFRHRVYDDRSLSHTVELGHRDMFDLGVFTWIENVLVDLIGKAKRVNLLAKFGDEFHLVAIEYFARRIIRIADDNRFGVFIERRSQLVAIEAPVGRAP